ncbi:MAG: threonine aldolase family protein, partial [Myxococcota bacterium]
MKPVDLRSDTVTTPTAAMRAAMAAAEVGDDCYGEDPTVRALEERAAALLGKESALFVPSGTMANQIALQLHCRPGDLVYVGEDAHLGRYESGAGSAYAGVQLETVPGPPELGPGLFDAAALAATHRGEEYDQPRPGLVAAEQTHNLSGGRVFPEAAFAEAAGWARRHGLPVHVDGARLWNAAAAAGLPEAALVAEADTVSACFSKGLGAPVGSVLGLPAAARPDALRL